MFTNLFKAIVLPVVNFFQLSIIPNRDPILLAIALIAGVAGLIFGLIRLLHHKDDHRHGGPKSGCGHRLPGSKLGLIRRIINGSRRFGKMVFQN